MDFSTHPAHLVFMFESFPDRPLNCAIIGATGGIGAAMADLIAEGGRAGNRYLLSRSGGGKSLAGAHNLTINIEDEASIEAAAQTIGENGQIDLLFIASGILHDGAAIQPEKSLRQIDPDAMAKVFAVNTIGPALCIKHFSKLLPREGKSVIAALSARVGSISDNGLGGWYSYRASKTALNQIIKSASIEIGRNKKQAICIGLHPGTVATDLSEPFQNNSYERFTPERSANHLLDVIDGLKTDATGSVFDWKGERIPE